MEGLVYGRLYGLIDPRDGCLRYVGQTIHSLPFRLIGHCRDGRLATAKGRWIAELLSLGLCPCIADLGTFPIDKLDIEEIALIASVRAAGAILFNISRGGGRPLKRHKRRNKRKPVQWDRRVSMRHFERRLDREKRLQRELPASDLEQHRYAMREEE